MPSYSGDIMNDMTSDDWIVVTYDGTETAEMTNTVGICTHKVCFSSEDEATAYAYKQAVTYPGSAFGVYRKAATFKFIVSRFSRK